MKTTKKLDVSRRDFLKWSALAGTSALIASCAPAPAAEPAAEAASAAADSGAAASEATPIRFSTWWGTFWNDYAPLIEEKTNTLATLESTPWSEYHDKLKLQLASGTAADVIMIANVFMGDFWTANQLQPFDDHLVIHNFDASKYYWDPVEVGGYQGEILGLDQYVAHPCIFHVNKTLTDELGLTDTLPQFGSDNFDEWQFDDLVAFCEAVAENSAGMENEIWSIAGPLMSGWSYCTKHFVYGNNGQQFDTWWYEGDETTCLLDSPESIEAITKTIDLTLQGHTYLEAVAGPIEGGTYRAGRAALALAPVGLTLYPSDSLDFEKAYIHAPWFKQRAIHTTGDFLTVNKSSEVLDAAMDYAITQIIDEDVGRQFVQTSGLSPAYNSAQYYGELEDGSEIQSVAGIHLSRWEGFSAYPEQAAASIHYPGHDGFKAAAYMRDTLRSAFEAALIGESEAGVAVTEAVADINAELAAKS